MGDTAGGQLIVGGVVSITSTVWLQEAELPLQSVAVQVRVTLYTPAQLPGVVASTKVTTGLGSQVSLALGSGNTGVFGHCMGDTAGGQLITGGVVSITSTVWLQEAELPLQSVAVQVRVILYTPWQLPGVVTSANVTVGDWSQLSLAVGFGNSGAFGHWMGDTGAGHVMTGGVVSITSTVWLHEALLPLQSVAVQVRVTLYTPWQLPSVVTSANVTVGD